MKVSVLSTNVGFKNYINFLKNIEKTFVLTELKNEEYRIYFFTYAKDDQNSTGVYTTGNWRLKDTELSYIIIKKFDYFEDDYSKKEDLLISLPLSEKDYYNFTLNSICRVHENLTISDIIKQPIRKMYLKSGKVDGVGCHNVNILNNLRKIGKAHETFEVSAIDVINDDILIASFIKLPKERKSSDRVVITTHQLPDYLFRVVIALDDYDTEKMAEIRDGFDDVVNTFYESELPIDNKELQKDLNEWIVQQFHSKSNIEQYYHGSIAIGSAFSILSRPKDPYASNLFSFSGHDGETLSLIDVLYKDHIEIKKRAKDAEDKLKEKEKLIKEKDEHILSLIEICKEQRDEHLQLGKKIKETLAILDF